MRVQQVSNVTGQGQLENEKRVLLNEEVFTMRSTGMCARNEERGQEKWGGEHLKVVRPPWLGVNRKGFE